MTVDDGQPLCPYCGAPQDLFLEPGGSLATQEFVEECPECCHEFAVHVEWDQAGDPRIRVRREE